MSQFLKLFSLPKPTDALPEQKNLKRFLYLQRFGFAAVGIDPTSKEQTICNRFLVLIPVFSMTTLIVPIMLYVLKNRSVNLDDAITAAAPMCQATLSVIKFIIFMVNRKKIVPLVRKVWLWALEADEEELKILEEENRYDAMVATFYYGSVYVTGVLAVLAPLLISAVYSWQGYGFWETLNEPLKAEYGFLLDVENSVVGYMLGYTWNVLGIHYVLNGTLAIDSLFTWFMRNISAQFRILNIRFQLAAAEGNRCENETQKSIIKCIQYHWRIIEVVHEFDDSYRNIIFAEFVVSCIQLAFIAFLIPRGGELVDKIFTISFLVSVLIQLMVYCYGGQRIQDTSTSVESQIYQSFQWQNLSVKIKKLLILSMMRSQKPCTLTGIFFVSNLSLYVWVMRTAGSFMTMMMSVSQEK